MDGRREREKLIVLYIRVGTCIVRVCVYIYICSGLLNFWGQIETKRAAGMCIVRVYTCVYVCARPATLRYHPLTGHSKSTYEVVLCR